MFLDPAYFVSLPHRRPRGARVQGRRFAEGLPGALQPGNIHPNDRGTETIAQGLMQALLTARLALHKFAK
jgi:hypothetical protein